MNSNPRDALALHLNPTLSDEQGLKTYLTDMYDQLDRLESFPKVKRDAIRNTCGPYLRWVLKDPDVKAEIQLTWKMLRQIRKMVIGHRRDVIKYLFFKYLLAIGQECLHITIDEEVFTARPGMMLVHMSGDRVCVLPQGGVQIK